MRLLTQHLLNVAEAMQAHSKRCGLAEHGDNSGAAREALCKLFLEQHLPHTVSYFTGEIFDQKDERSGQIDLILHPSWSPRLNLVNDIDLVFADAALATVEVKSTLTTAAMDKPSHLKAALDSCVRTKRLSRTAVVNGEVGGQAIELPNLPVLVFAFEGPTFETLVEKLEDFRQMNGVAPEEMPDLITVLGKGYYVYRNTGWLHTKLADEKILWSRNEEPEAVLLGMYAYLTKVIEASVSAPQFTRFSAYLRDLADDA